MRHYTEPVTGKDFFAREDIFADLVKSAHSIKQGYRQNIALIGSGLIGKSSILLHFLNSLSNDQEIMPVYLDISQASFKEFALSFINSLFYHAMKRHIKAEEMPDAETLIKNAQKIFPQSHDMSSRVLFFIDSGKYDEAFSLIWDIPALITSESGCFTVLVVDEFNRLSSFPVKKPYRVLGQKIMVQKKTLFVLSSSTAVTAKKILSEKLSLLFGGFKIIDIGPFSTKEALKFISEKVKAATVPKPMSDFIAVFTGGHPFYLNAITTKISFAFAYGAEKITTKRLSAILAELLFHPSGVINQFFQNVLSLIHQEMPDANILNMLKSLLKTGSFAEIQSRNTVSATELSLLVNNLLECGFIEKSGSLYAITDPLFRIWIEVKFKSRNLCFDFIPSQEFNDYAKEVELRIASFRAEQGKSLNNKLIELISCFDNNRFFIDERVRLLPKVERITSKILCRHSILSAEGGKKKCFFIVARKRVNEEYVSELYDRIKAIKTKRPRIVLITLFGIEPAAKVSAKQKSFLIWNRDDTVRLFNFYKGYNSLIA
jgi:DNA-binding Lrp family transcriptional regulator